MSLAATLAAPTAYADAPRYRYVALDNLTLPSPYTAFWPSVVVGDRVFGTVYDDTYATINVAVYQGGRITIGPAGAAHVANEQGIIGGSDPSSQAAVFRRDTTTLVPRLPGETTGIVIGLGHNDLNLEQSTGTSYVSTYAYFRRGTETVIDFGLPDPVFGAFMNEDGVVTVTKEGSPTDYRWRGYRYDPGTGTSTLLPPYSADPTEDLVLVQGINKRGEVLGYSFTSDFGSGYHESIGIWSRQGIFEPYYTEMLNTSMLVFNDRDQIVITNPAFYTTTTSYLVTAVGTRLDLANLVVNVPAGLLLQNIASIDNDGNMTGYATDESGENIYPFLLLPMNNGDAAGQVHAHGCKLSSEARRHFENRHPHK